MESGSVRTKKHASERRASAVLLALAAGVFVSACQKSAADNPPGAGAPALPVQVRIAPSVKIPDTTEYLSILKSRHSATINPQVEGQITRIFVKSGEHVKAGTPLLQIDPLKQEATVNSQEASRAAQEANVRYAKVSLERAQKLLDAGVISKQEYDNAQTAYDAAVAQLKALDEQVRQQKVQLHYYSVTSPMDGIVGDVPVRMGDRVTVTTLLTTIDERGALEAYIYVPAERAHNLKVGLPVRLLDAAGNSLSETRVTFVSPQVDSDTQSVLAKATVRQRNLGAATALEVGRYGRQRLCRAGWHQARRSHHRLRDAILAGRRGGRRADSERRQEDPGKVGAAEEMSGATPIQAKAEPGLVR